jgi:RNA polymerase sigma-70 factor (ECF subfamily)
MKKMMTKPSDDEVHDARPVLWDKETERLIKAERASLLQYACYRLGDVDEAEDAVQDVCLNLLSRVKAEVRNPVAYLYRMLSNLCSTRLKE